MVSSHIFPPAAYPAWGGRGEPAAVRVRGPREYSETPTCKSDFLCGLQNAKSRGETGNGRDSGAKVEELLSGSCWLCAGGNPGTPQIRGPVRGCLLLPSVATEKEKEEERKERNEADDGRVARCARAPEE